MVSFNRNEDFIVNHTNVASTTEDLVCRVKTPGASDQYRGGVVDVVTEGLVQGVGGVVKKSIICIVADASGVPTSATVLANGGTGITHTATIVSGEVQIKATYTAGSPGSKFTHYCRNTGCSLIFKKG